MAYSNEIVRRARQQGTVRALLHRKGHNVVAAQRQNRAGGQRHIRTHAQPASGRKHIFIHAPASYRSIHSIFTSVQTG